MMADSESFTSPDRSIQEHGINEYIGLPPSWLDLWKKLHAPLAVCFDSLEDWWTRIFDRLDMPANAEAASRNTSSACWIDWETDGCINSHGRRKYESCGKNDSGDWAC